MEYLTHFSAGVYGVLMLVVFLFEVIITLVAFADCVMRPEKAFIAADKQKKPFWMLILCLAALSPWISITMFGPLGFLTILGVAAAIIYLVDVRPALKQAGGKILRRRAR